MREKRSLTGGRYFHAKQYKRGKKIVAPEKVRFMDKMEIKSEIFPIFLTGKKRAKQKTLVAPEKVLSI